ncbi:MAG: glutathione-regulated potassium-efflux system ancillary protein KefC [bacterium]
MVAAVAVSQKWLSNDWLIMMAVLVASSFVISSSVNNYSDDFYTRFKHYLNRFQRSKRLETDEDVDLSGVQILVCGMGRVGCGAFDEFLLKGHTNILGLDFSEQTATKESKNGRKTSVADVSNPEFWDSINMNNIEIEWVLLCTPHLRTNSITASLARSFNFKGFISAAVKYPEEDKILKEAGVDAVFNIYSEAGSGLTQHGQAIFDEIKEDKQLEAEIEAQKPKKDLRFNYLE